LARCANLESNRLYQDLARFLFFVVWRRRLARAGKAATVSAATNGGTAPLPQSISPLLEVLDAVPALRPVAGPIWLARDRAAAAFVEGTLNERWGNAKLAIEFYERAADEIDQGQSQDPRDRANYCRLRALAFAQTDFAHLRRRPHANLPAAALAFRQAAALDRRGERLLSRLGIQVHRNQRLYHGYWKHLAEGENFAVCHDIERAFAHLDAAVFYAKRRPSALNPPWYRTPEEVEAFRHVLAAQKFIGQQDLTGTITELDSWLTHPAVRKEGGRYLRVRVRRMAAELLFTLAECSCSCSARAHCRQPSCRYWRSARRAALAA
jgi:hypothetical protein